MQERARKLAMVRSEPTLIIGVDVAKFTHWAVAMDGQTELQVGRAFSFQNTREGFGRLLGQIVGIQGKTRTTRVVVGMEPSGHYWKPLAWFLRQSGVTVVTVNPHHVKKSKEFEDNSPTKTDRKDAWLIAKRVQAADFLEPYLAEGVYAELRVLTQTRQQHVVKWNAAVNQLRGWLDEYFPEFVGVFRNLYGKAAWYVLNHRPVPADILEVSVQELAVELGSATTGRVGLKRATRLRDAAENSIGVGVGLEAAHGRLRQLLSEVAFWKDRLAEDEAGMKRCLEATGLAPYLLSVPGVGVVTAAAFLGEIGDVERFEDWRQVRKLAGLNLTEQSSGVHKGRTQISKRGRSHLRYVLVQAAVMLIAKNREFAALYQHFRSRAVNPLKGKQALVAVACKLLRVLFTLARQHRYYDPEKALGRWRMEQLSLAA